MATDRFLREIRGSHEVVSYVDVIGTNAQVMRLKATDGTVNVDRTTEFRRSGSFTCVDPEGVLVPKGSAGILLPLGTEARLYRGVRYTNKDGSKEEEVLPLGVFTLTKTTIKESASSGAVTFTCEFTDRSRRISRQKFKTTYVIPAGTNLITAIKLILGRTYPNLEYDAIGTSMVTTAVKVFDASADPWQAAKELATSLGCELYFDVNGDVVIAPPTDIDSMPQPSFTYIEGQGCTMTDMDVVFSDSPGYNGVIVTGESAADGLAPVRAEAWDNEPSSATYRGGSYGEVPMFVTDSNVKTAAQAQVMADSLLKGQLGFSAQLNLTASVNPALEAGNVVQVRRRKMNVSGLYAVDAFAIPLKKDSSQSLTIRQKRQAS